MKKGFTLIELMVVMAVIAVLVLIAVVAIDPTRLVKEARDARARTNANQVKTALQLYFNENRRYPTNSEFTTSGSPPNFTPTYMKALPNPAPTYTQLSSGASYEASININIITADDNNAGEKCGKAAQPIGSSGFYWICPD